MGEIVLVREDNVPRRVWKLAKIKQFIFSKDGQIRSVIIILPNKYEVSRAINQLSPLEIPSQDSNEVQLALTEIQTQKDNSVESGSKRISTRTAAVRACQRIAECLKKEMVTTVFSFSLECHGVEMILQQSADLINL